MDRVVEADALLPPRQLFRHRACPPLAVRALVGVFACEVGLDEVARHELDAKGAGLTEETSEVLKFDRPMPVRDPEACAPALCVTAPRALRR
jgi:hypothetical protein